MDNVINDKYAIYCADNMTVISNLPDKSVGLCVTSPPFFTPHSGLYKYSSSEFDYSNCDSKKQFFDMFELLTKELNRVMMDGRIVAIHCTDVHNNKDGSLYDFPHDIIKMFQENGFDYKNRITVWKEPLQVRLRTMVASLMHVTIVEDCTEAFPASPDYVLIFKKRGQNKIPVTHPNGFKRYYGEIPILPIKKGKFSDLVNEETDDYVTLSNKVFKALQNKYRDFDGYHTANELSQVIWRRYASSVWDDIRIDNVLPFQDSKDPDDEKHVHPLQLDVYDRLIEMYTNAGEVVLEPFMGVGSGVYSAVSLNRKGVGTELKPSYFKQAVKNLAMAENRFASEQIDLFSVLESSYEFA